ncbi:MAG TPA: lysophospholipid acyltransferase family protein [Thermoanaerobaculia bacterium]
MRLLRSLAAWTAIVVSTILFAILAIPLSQLPGGGKWFQRCSKGWSALILGAAGVRFRVLHPERMRGDGPYVIASNHESFFDIPVLFAALPMPVRFLAKRNLFRLPFLGWAMAAAGFVPVDRADHSHGKEMLDTALSRLQGDRSLVVFPEQTRTRTGELSPFKSGAAVFAIKSGMPLLPVGLAGTFAVLRRDSFWISPGIVTVAVGEPLSVEGRTTRDRAAVTASLRGAIEACRDEARAADIRSESKEP